MASITQEQTYLRFGLARRVEHWVLVLSFSLLAITGLAQKYSELGISISIISLLGGIQTTRIIHRVAAVIFGLQSILHVIYAFYLVYVRRQKANMAPGIKDIKDFFQAIGYNLGFVKEAPKLGRYNFAEKLEYWAMVWGLILMGLTGFMLWNPITTTRMLPGQFIPAAKIAHGMEAVLAVLAILIWHFYHSHIKVWNKSMFNGRMTRHEMEEEHALELAEIESGEHLVELNRADTAKRMKIFVPVAGIVAIALVSGLVYFVTAENTAITTVMLSDSEQGAFVPLPPTPIPSSAPVEAAPTSENPAPTESAPTIGEATAWSNGIDQIFASECGLCHGELGGLKVGTYADLMDGVNGVPVVISGDADNSLVVTVTQENHPGRFDEAELQLIKDWINNGLKE